MCLPSFGTSEPTVGTPGWSRPMGFYPFLQGLPYLYVCYVCLYVSHLPPRRGSRRQGFPDVGPKVLIRYYYHSYGAQFLCWRLSLGEDGKSPTYWRGGVAKSAKGIQNAHFATGQKLTHSPAHEEKHAGQETPLHYTH